jgi:DNA-binding SARP family transcriptional activator
LGPIEAWRDGHAIRLNGLKGRSVLAALLLRANRVVLTERLLAVLWGERPPVTAVAQVHKYVSQLRAELGQECIVRFGNGYKLEIRPDGLDLLRFDQSVRSARAALAAGRLLEAAEEFRTALALWRGEPVADGTEELIRTEAPALEERKIAALLEKIEIELALGWHGELVGELHALLAEYPLREQLRGHLMLALYRCGRVAEALTTYHDGRALLADELGLDPGPELQQLHVAILAGDPGLAVKGGGAEPLRSQSAPAQLPPSIADFTGRADEIELICKTLTTGHEDAPAIMAISGKGGVGKTTLAVHAARRVSDAFPDGHLYVRLRGLDARPVDPLVALQRFLRALGVEDLAVPDNLDECSQLFRSRSATHRLLILLDDAANEAQVRPLLPGSPTCAVLVTSRPRLNGLEGAGYLALDVFDSEESVELLERIAGAHRFGNDHATTLEIARLCGHLPLAVRIAAARFAQHARGDLAWFARRLADERRRLDVLVAGDLGVRASLGVGYQGLGVRERQAFALLSLLDAPDFAAWAVAPLLGVTVDEAEDIVEELVNAQLLDIVSCGVNGQIRYRYHDLVRLYARERIEAEHPEPQRRAALARALGAWLTLATEAGERFHGTRFRGWSSRSFADSAYYNGFDSSDIEILLESPLLWFEVERTALATAVAQACSHGLSSLAWALAESITDFLELRHLYADWETTHSLALGVCEAEGNSRGVGVMLLRLARMQFIRKNPSASLALAERARSLLEDLGHKAIEAECLVVHAAALRTLGEHVGALDVIGQAIALARASANRLAEVQATRELGTIWYEQAQWDRASEAFHDAVELAREVHSKREEALSLRYRAVVLRHSERFEDARRLAESALAIFRELGDRPYEAFSCLTLGMILLQLSDPSARRFVEEGHSALQEMNLEFGAGEVLHVRAALELAEGRIDEAVDRLIESIGILSADPVHHVLINTVELLSHALRAAGDTAEAEAVRLEAAELSRHVGKRPALGSLRFGHLVRGPEAHRKKQGTAPE